MKALATAVIQAHSVLGFDEVDKSLQEAVMAYNAGVSAIVVSAQLKWRLASNLVMKEMSSEVSHTEW